MSLAKGATSKTTADRLSLFIDDAVRPSLTNLGLERKLNDFFAAGNEARRLSRKQFWDSVGEGEGQEA
jgi:hypothetical protein